MSTRSIIVVAGRERYGEALKVTRLYKHSDGYPSGNLPIIKDALAIALFELDEQNKRFKSKVTVVCCDHVVGKVIGEASDVYGMGAVIDSYDKDKATYTSKQIELEHFGNHGDLEWIYFIDLKANHLGVYGSDVEGGYLDPISYADQLREECQAEEREEIKKSLKEIETLGFKVNDPKHLLKFTKGKKKGKAA